MNFAALDSVDAPRRQRRIAIGIALSIALHALLLWAWRAPLLRETEAPPRPRSIAVWIRPPPASIVPPQEPQARPGPRTPGPARKRTRPLIAAPPPGRAPAHTEPFTLEQAPRPQAPPSAPHFDREAARHFARQIADEPDPAKAGTAVGQFPEPALETETLAARAIASAKRRNCKDGIPGGLLAPLILLLDKKDSGCKW